MDKIKTLEKAMQKIKNGDTIMIGGFLGNGVPYKLIDYLVEKNIKDLTLICNDSGLNDIGVGKMVHNKQFKKIITSHIGTNKETGRQMNEGETEVVLTPQGTLVEQIRSAGYGLGGVLTKTGLGTLVEEGKEKIIIDGETFLLEKPLRADFALLNAHQVDSFGNIIYKGSENNFNHVMAAAADVTIVEAGNIVESGDLNPNHINTPGIFIDYVVEGGRINE